MIYNYNMSMIHTMSMCVSITTSMVTNVKARISIYGE